MYFITLLLSEFNWNASMNKAAGLYPQDLEEQNCQSCYPYMAFMGHPDFPSRNLSFLGCFCLCQ